MLSAVRWLLLAAAGFSNIGLIFCDKIDDADAAAARGNFQLAIRRFTEAAEETTSIGDKAYAFAGIANCHTSMKAFNLAGDAFRQAGAVQCKPEFFFNAGMAYAEQAAADRDPRWEEAALDSFRSCAGCQGNVRPCVLKIAQIYRDRDDFEQVQDALMTAVRLAPQNHDAYVHLGDVLNNRKFFTQALEWYGQGLAALHRARAAGMPDHLSMPALVQVHNSMGHACSNTKRLADALAHYQSAKALAAGGAADVALLEAMVGSYFTAQDLAQWRHHEVDQARLVQLSARLLQQQGRRAGGDQPEYPLSPYRCMFLDSFGVGTGPGSVGDLFANISAGVAANLRLHSGASAVASAAAPDDEAAGAQGLRVGYISRRFTDYPGTQMMLRLFGAHSRGDAGVFLVAIASGPDDEVPAGSGRSETEYRRIIRSTSDAFVDVSLLSPGAAAAALAALRLDVLVDYDGMHDFNNFNLLAQLGRLQERLGRDRRTRVLSWLGFAGPLGQGARGLPPSQNPGAAGGPTDYVLADRHVTPPDTVGGPRRLRDAVVLLPTTYQPQDEQSDSMLFADAVVESPPAATEEAALAVDVDGVPAGGVVAAGEALYASLASSVVADPVERALLRRHLLAKYPAFMPETEDAALDTGAVFARQATGLWFICFNRMEKVTPDAFSDWMQVLRGRGAGQARLVLQASSPAVVASLRAAARFHGVAAHRLVLFPRLAKRDYSLLLGLADLFLDTRFYNAHTIATDAMYRQTPVLTLSGNSFASRVGGSLNNALDHRLCGEGHREFCDSQVGVGSLLTAHSRKDYEDTAVRLAGAGGRVLRQMRPHVRSLDWAASISDSVMFNSRHYARQLQRAFEAVSEPRARSETGRNRNIFFAGSI